MVEGFSVTLQDGNNIYRKTMRKKIFQMEGNPIQDRYFADWGPIHLVNRPDPFIDMIC